MTTTAHDSKRARTLLTLVCLMLISVLVTAEVERIEITSRVVFAEGMDFGDAGDPRQPVASRYAARKDYVAAVAAAAKKLAADRLLLPEDADACIDFAGRMAWPPEEIDSAPYWRLER